MSSAYKKLVAQTGVPETSEQTAETELDSLLSLFKGRESRNVAAESAAPDRIELLRLVMVNDLVPAFLELKEKYAAAGISMEMDVSNFLQGGREIAFELGLKGYRSKLLGTVTDEAIAFHETRHAPDLPGELVSGPMLRLHHLNAETFRSFLCERLALLLRTALRRR